MATACARRIRIEHLEAALASFRRDGTTGTDALRRLGILVRNEELQIQEHVAELAVATPTRLAADPLTKRRRHQVRRLREP